MYQAKRFPYVGSVYLLLIKDSKIVLLRRQNTGYYDGHYGLIAGHMEGSETATQAMIREASEESGISLKPEDLQCVHVMHRKGLDDERIDFFFTANTWEGDIINNEPDKCDDIDWFDVDTLPVNTIDYIRKAIENHTKDVSYSEYGW